MPAIPGERRDVRAAASRFQCPMPNALISESFTAVQMLGNKFVLTLNSGLF